jgi:ribosome-associated heat shock protein Hsp15
MPLPRWRRSAVAEARDAGPTMRLDRFLWFTRLAKTRDAAQTMATEGRLRIDGRVIDRAHAAVRIGNILTFFKAGNVRVVRVEILPVRRGPAPEAQRCYRELEAGAGQGLGPGADGVRSSANVSQEGEGN